MTIPVLGITCTKLRPVLIYSVSVSYFPETAPGIAGTVRQSVASQIKRITPIPVWITSHAIAG
jgi:hypothetical protein